MPDPHLVFICTALLKSIALHRCLNIQEKSADLNIDSLSSDHWDICVSLAISENTFEFPWIIVKDILKSINSEDLPELQS